jgi:hypothetical protein
LRAAKIVVIALLAYVAIVVVFESSIGILQPSNEQTLVITTFDGAKAPHDRVVSRLEHDGRTYVAANHWPRAWYKRALANPDVQATIDGAKRDYTAVPVTGAEHEQVDAAHRLPLAFRFVTGFPPRYFVRLDPR